MSHLLASDGAIRYSSLKPQPPKNNRYVFFLFVPSCGIVLVPETSFCVLVPSILLRVLQLGNRVLKACVARHPYPCVVGHVPLFVFMPLFNPPAPLSLIPAPLASGRRTGSFPDMRVAAACSWRASTAAEEAVCFPPPATPPSGIGVAFAGLEVALSCTWHMSQSRSSRIIAGGGRFRGGESSRSHASKPPASYWPI